MGKGDQKSTRGKRNAGSYGKTRLRKKSSAKAIPVKVLDDNNHEAPKAAVRKKVGEQTDLTENAEIKPKKSAAKTKKTEE